MSVELSSSQNFLLGTTGESGIRKVVVTSILSEISHSCVYRVDYTPTYTLLEKRARSELTVHTQLSNAVQVIHLNELNLYIIMPIESYSILRRGTGASIFNECQMMAVQFTLTAFIRKNLTSSMIMRKEDEETVSAGTLCTSYLHRSMHRISFPPPLPTPFP